MSEDGNSNKKNTDPKVDSANKTLSEDERKKLIEKIKASLFLEDQESVQLYASLIKNNI